MANSFARRHMARDFNAHQKWRESQGRFRSIGDGKFGGYKRGIGNGPLPTTERGIRRVTKPA